MKRQVQNPGGAGASSCNTHTSKHLWAGSRSEGREENNNQENDALVFLWLCNSKPKERSPLGSECLTLKPSFASHCLYASWSCSSTLLCLSFLLCTKPYILFIKCNTFSSHRIYELLSFESFMSLFMSYLRVRIK